jgi:hypothetical protein
MSDKPETVNEEVVESAEVPAALTVQDLVNLRSIIDVASGRGAFKAAEFQVVGEAYTKLNEFIIAITPAQEAPAEAPAEEVVAEGGE